MDHINNISIKSLKTLLESSYSLIDLLLTLIPQKILNEENNIQVISERQLNLLKSFLQSIVTISPNTVFAKLYVDPYALMEQLNRFGNPIENVTFEPNENNEYEMSIFYSRYAMNGNGFHVGYENVTFKSKAILKSELDIPSVYPRALSSYVIDPYSFEIDQDSKNFPDEEWPELISHDSDCAVHSMEPPNDFKEIPFPDECDCGLNESWNGYFPPEDDFFEGEINNIINIILTNSLKPLPEAEFYEDDENRYWEIGNEVTWYMNESGTEE